MNRHKISKGNQIPYLCEIGVIHRTNHRPDCRNCQINKNIVLIIFPDNYRNQTALNLRW